MRIVALHPSAIFMYSIIRARMRQGALPSAARKDRRIHRRAWLFRRNRAPCPLSPGQLAINVIGYGHAFSHIECSKRSPPWSVRAAKPRPYAAPRAARSAARLLAAKRKTWSATNRPGRAPGGPARHFGAALSRFLRRLSCSCAFCLCRLRYPPQPPPRQRRRQRPRRFLPPLRLRPLPRRPLRLFPLPRQPLRLRPLPRQLLRLRPHPRQFLRPARRFPPRRLRQPNPERFPPRAVNTPCR